MPDVGLGADRPRRRFPSLTTPIAATPIERERERGPCRRHDRHCHQNQRRHDVNTPPFHAPAPTYRLPTATFCPPHTEQASRSSPSHSLAPERSFSRARGAGLPPVRGRETRTRTWSWPNLTGGRQRQCSGGGRGTDAADQPTTEPFVDRPFYSLARRTFFRTSFSTSGDLVRDRQSVIMYVSPLVLLVDAGRRRPQPGSPWLMMPSSTPTGSAPHSARSGIP